MADGTIRINAPITDYGVGYVTVNEEVFDYLLQSGMVIFRKGDTNLGLRLYRDEQEG